MRLNELIEASSRAAMALQAADGAFPAGRNGPYSDRETPVRNTAHWLITLLHVHALGGDPAPLRAAERALAYLLRPEHRPMGASFYCREGPERDLCNGLIGQAWAIEALASAAGPLGEPRAMELAVELFLRHAFTEQTGLWRALNVEGTYGPYDMTFNHQLWFAASGALLEGAQAGEARRRVRRFLDRTLVNHLKVDRSGRINHFVPDPGRRSPARRALGAALGPLKRLRPRPQMVGKEIGYHAFNLYAFGLLRRGLPDHPLWQSPRLRAALRFVDSPVYERGLEGNTFGYPYNPPGFEVAFARQSFPEAYGAGGRPDAWWVAQQLRRCYDPATGLLSRGTEDAHTLAARLYEATRLRDMELGDFVTPRPAEHAPGV